MMAAHERRAPAVLMVAYTNYETDPRVVRAAEAAVEAGFRVDFIALSRTGQAEVAMVRGVRVLRVAQQRYRAKSRIGYARAYLTFFLRALVLSTRLHVANRYRVVHVNNMPDVLVFAFIVPKLLGAKVLLDIHDPMPETFGAKYAGQKSRFFGALLAMERLSVAFADAAVTVNEPVRDEILAKHGHKAGAIGVIANFADDRLFRPLPPPVVGDRVRFVFHGTILERYGMRTLIDAVAKVRNRRKIHVRIIGEGDFSEPLKNHIEARGVGDVVEFTNRFFPLYDLPAILSDCHVGLVPLDVTAISDFALPLKLIEYTCLGLPSITVPSTAIRHYLRSDEGLFYPPGDSDALAALIDRIADDPGCLDALRSKLPAARERMSWTREKTKYVALLRDLAGEPAPERQPIAVAQEANK